MKLGDRVGRVGIKAEARGAIPNTELTILSGFLPAPIYSLVWVPRDSIQTM